MWLSLIRTCSPRESGGCGSRRSGPRIFRARGIPGVVLRVSTMRTPGPGPVGEPPRERGDPGEALDEIERRSLGRQERGRGPDGRSTRALAHALAVAGQDAGDDRRIDPREDAGGHLEPQRTRSWPGGDVGARRVALREDRPARHVALAGVLLQGQVDQMVSARVQGRTSFLCSAGALGSGPGRG
jgi:hypothetical protein